MKGLRKRVIVGVLTAAICMTSGSAAFAAGKESEKKGFWSSVGGWFVDRGNDISEVSAIVGNWTSDRTNDFVVLVTDTGEAIVCAASNFDPSVLTTKEYYLDSGEKVLLGAYSDKDPTALSMGLNLAASVANVDLGMDIRDLVYDVQNYGSGEVKLSGLALDAVAILPVIGVVKCLKYADTAVDVVDNVHDAAKTAEAIEIVSDTAKVADSIDNAADAAKLTDDAVDTAKTVDIVDDAVDAGKEITKIPFEELPEKVQENYKMYADCGWDGEKALENMSDGTDAGRVFKNKDGDLPSIDSNGKELSYTEYDAYQKGDDPIIFENYPDGRGPGRFVRDNLGNIYFTEDHYETFKLISD